MTECAYCGCRVEDHEPVVVTEPRDTGTTTVGHFCNYACLSSFIERESLVDGAFCRIDAS